MRIEIHDAHSQVDLPSNLSTAALQHLQKVWVAGQQLDIARDDDSQPARREPSDALDKPRRSQNRPSKNRSERKAAIANRKRK